MKIKKHIALLVLIMLTPLQGSADENSAPNKASNSDPDGISSSGGSDKELVKPKRKNPEPVELELESSGSDGGIRA